MSPGAHFIASWLVGVAGTDNARDRKLVTLAGVLPDLDGLGLVADVVNGWFTGGKAGWHYYHRYHHYLTHGWPAALVITGLLVCFARRKGRTALLCLLTFHLHLLCDLLGSRGPGPEDFWPILYSAPLFRKPVWIWPGQWPLYCWQNGLIFAALLIPAVWISARNDFTFLEIFGRRVDSTFARMLRIWTRGANSPGALREPES